MLYRISYKELPIILDFWMEQKPHEMLKTTKVQVAFPKSLVSIDVKCEKLTNTNKDDDGCKLMTILQHGHLLQEGYNSVSHMTIIARKCGCLIK